MIFSFRLPPLLPLTDAEILRALVLLLLQLALSSGLIHNLRIQHDQRGVSFIEDFGFRKGGEIQMTLTEWTIDEAPITEDDAKLVGFYIKVTSTEVLKRPKDFCESPDDGSIAPVRPSPGHTALNFTLEITEPGLYSLFFVNCISRPSTAVSFELTLAMFNRDGATPNFLSVGLSPLPWLFVLLTLAWTGALFLWSYILRSPATKSVHYLMGAVIICKILQLFFAAFVQHVTRLVGNAGGWGIVYSIITTIKGLVLFTAIALIGTGWSFMKAFLSVVIPLQILANVALGVTKELAPGSQTFSDWYLTLQLVDIMCCLAVLVPIIWSIRHLRQAAVVNDKAAVNLENLKLFRQFYVVVLCWIYFTRILVDLMFARLNYQYLWLSDFTSELATLAFACWTGWKFQPHEQSPRNPENKKSPV